jgi:hypothetical protein
MEIQPRRVVVLDPPFVPTKEECWEDKNNKETAGLSSGGFGSCDLELLILVRCEVLAGMQALKFSQQGLESALDGRGGLNLIEVCQ